MKFKITLKDPDGFWEAVTETVESNIGEIKGLSSDEVEKLVDSRRDETFEAISEWVKFNEYITIEFDTEAGTATVCKL